MKDDVTLTLYMSPAIKERLTKLAKEHELRPTVSRLGAQLLVRAMDLYELEQQGGEIVIRDGKGAKMP